MRRHRYFVVEHAEPQDKKSFIDLIIPIHTLLGTYHWTRLDAQHILVTGYYEVSNHSALHNHPKVSPLPTVGSSKTLKAHLATKANHWNVLASNLSLTDNSTTADMAEKAEEKYGTMFGAAD